MIGPKLDTTGADSPEVAHRRNLFDRHMDTCQGCQPVMCETAQSLWREVCLFALRAVSVRRHGV